MSESTPRLADVIQKAVKTSLLETHTSMPGVVVSYDRNTQTASIQPSIKRRYLNGEAVNLPIIQNVPVCFPSGSDFFIHYDLKKDDDVLIIFSERSIDNWFLSGGVVESSDKRTHSLNDAFCIPGVRPKNKPRNLLGEDGSFEISNNGNSIIITKDGKVKINNSSNELISLLVELVSEMISGKNLTGVGPLGKDPAYLVKLNEIKSKMETFIL